MRALSYHEQDIGQFIKSTKKKYTWKFSLNGADFTTTLKVSKLSGNYEVQCNNDTLYKGNKSYDAGFSFEFKL